MKNLDHRHKQHHCEDRDGRTLKREKNPVLSIVIVTGVLYCDIWDMVISNRRSEENVYSRFL